MAFVTGQRTTGNVNTNLHVREVYPDIWNPESWNNSRAAMTALMVGMNKKRSVKNFKAEFIEDTYLPPFAKINAGAGYNTTDTTFTVDSGHGISDHDTNDGGGGTVVWNPRTGEAMLVTATTATTLVVIRNYGSTISTGGKVAAGVEGTGLALLDDDYLVIAGSSYPEGINAPTAISTQGEISYNYTEYFRMTGQITRRQSQIEQYGGNDLTYQQKKLGEQFKIRLNQTFWKGNRGTRTDATSGTIYTTTGGVFEHLCANALDISGVAYNSGTMTEKVLDEWGEKLQENGSDTRHVFSSHKFINGVGSLRRNLVRVDDKGTSFGTEMKEWMTASGLRFLFVAEPKVFNAGWSYTGTAVALDMSLLEYIYFKNDDVKMFEDIRTDNRPDSTKFEWAGDCGLIMKGYGLDHSNRNTSGSQRSPHGSLTGFSKY